MGNWYQFTHDYGIYRIGDTMVINYWLLTIDHRIIIFLVLYDIMILISLSLIPLLILDIIILSIWGYLILLFPIINPSCMYDIMMIWYWFPKKPTMVDEDTMVLGPSNGAVFHRGRDTNPHPASALIHSWEFLPAWLRGKNKSHETGQSPEFL